MGDDPLPRTDPPAFADLGEEEVLPGRDRPPNRRLRLELGGAAVILAVVAGIASAISHHAKPNAAASSTTPVVVAAPAPSVQPAAVASDFVTLSPEHGGWIPRDPIPCPVQGQCITTHGVSMPVRLAVGNAFPGWTIISSRTIRLSVKNYGEALVSLDVDAQLGDARLIIRLRGKDNYVHRSRSDPMGPGVVMLFGPNRITRYETTLSQFYVTIAVVAPASRRQTIEPLRQLGNDGRLLALW